MGQLEGIGARAVVRDQQPATTAFFKIMEAISGGSLAKSRNPKALVFFHCLRERIILRNQFGQLVLLDSICPPWNLDHVLKDRLVDAKKSAWVTYSFDANYSDFDRSAIFHRLDEGDDPPVHKMPVFDWLIHSADHFASR